MRRARAMITREVGPHRRGRLAWPPARVVGGVLYGAFAAGVATLGAFPALRWWLPDVGVTLLAGAAVLLLLPTGPALALFTLVRPSAAKLRAAAGAAVLTILAALSPPVVSTVGAAVWFDRHAGRLDALVTAMDAAGVHSVQPSWPRSVNGREYPPPPDPSGRPAVDDRAAEIARIMTEIDALRIGDVRVAEGGAVILLAGDRWLPGGTTLVLRRAGTAPETPRDLRMIQRLGGGWYRAAPTDAPY